MNATLFTLLAAGCTARPLPGHDRSADTRGGDSPGDPSEEAGEHTDATFDASSADQGLERSASTYTVCRRPGAKYVTIQAAIDAGEMDISLCPGRHARFHLDSGDVSIHGPSGTWLAEIRDLHEHLDAYTTVSGEQTKLTLRDLALADLIVVDAATLVASSIDCRVYNTLAAGSVAIVSEGEATLDRIRLVNQDIADGLFRVSDDGDLDVNHLVVADSTRSDNYLIEGNSARISIRNSVFAGNRAGWDGWPLLYGVDLLQNTVFYGNSYDDYALIAAPGAINAKNNAFVANYTPEGVFADYAGIFDDSYNLRDVDTVYGAATDPTDLVADPLFTDPDNLDFTLQPGSPAIDAGNPDAAYNDVDGTRNDIGAFGGPLGDWTP